MTQIAFPASQTRVASAAPDSPAANSQIEGTIDARAFAALYEETFDAVYRYALLLAGNRDTAEDIAAEVYLRAWRKRGAFRGEGAFLSWLLSITHNYATTSLRKAGREITDEETIQQEAEREADSPAPSLSGGERRRLYGAIRTLTAEQQQVIVLRFFQEWPHARIARHLGKEIPAIRSMQYRALHSLRGCGQPPAKLEDGETS
jgi:RNA polymerase sigma-70 factor (ECF subfamily)